MHSIMKAVVKSHFKTRNWNIHYNFATFAKLT